MKTHRVVSILGLLVSVSADRALAQWPQFRGPNGSGVDSSTGYPVEFSPTKTIFQNPREKLTEEYITGRFG